MLRILKNYNSKKQCKSDSCLIPTGHTKCTKDRGRQMKSDTAVIVYTGTASFIQVIMIEVYAFVLHLAE